MELEEEKKSPVYNVKAVPVEKVTAPVATTQWKSPDWNEHSGRYVGSTSSAKKKKKKTNT